MKYRGDAAADTTHRRWHRALLGCLHDFRAAGRIRGRSEAAKCAVVAKYGSLIRSFAGLFTRAVCLSSGLIAYFLFASFRALWSGIALPLVDSPWHLSETQIGLFDVAGLAVAPGVTRDGRCADARHSHRATGIAIVILLDIAVQAVPAVRVSNHHMLTTVCADKVSATNRAYMVFYFLGFALGAAPTTALCARAGWTGSVNLGAAFAAGGLTVGALSLRTG